MFGDGRSVHLLDIENMLGGGKIEVTAINAFFARYRSEVPMTDQDLVVVGVSSSEGLLALALSDLRNCRQLYRPGKNGADLILQEVLDTERLEDRFSTVYVGSGDGGFAASISALAGRGGGVVVVARPASLSKRLRLAAHRTIALHTEITGLDAA